MSRFLPSLLFTLAVTAASLSAIDNSASQPQDETSTANVSTLSVLQFAQGIISKAVYATLSTHAISNLAINSRMVYPKPTANVTNCSGLDIVFVATSNLTRKIKEISRDGNANLLYFDKPGAAYVSLRGTAEICTAAEAAAAWWNGWIPFHGINGTEDNYTAIRFEPNWLEVVDAANSFTSGLDNHDPVSLQRSGGKWSIIIKPDGPVPPVQWWDV